MALSREEIRRIDRTCMAVGWTVADEVRAGLIRRKRRAKTAAAFEEADGLWSLMKGCAPAERRELVAVFPEYRSWALALRLCERSVRAAADKADAALELAGLALFVAERAAEEEGFLSALQGWCWAHVANARRVANDFDGADRAFARAWSLWQAGAADPDLLPEWHLLSLEASLRRAQHRFAEALDLLDRARAACGGDATATGRILLQRGKTLEQSGDFEGSLAVLAEAEPWIEESGEPRLLLILRFNKVDDLCYLERYEDAAELLPRVRKLALEQANELDLTRLLWLQARVWVGLGQSEKAKEALEQVRRDFTVRMLPYDAALSSLDLAVLWLKEDRMAEVRALALGMAWIFKAQGIDREALVSLSLFCEAAKREAATVELTRRVIREIEAVRRSVPHPGNGARDRD